jgi:two-component system, OmpR family, response regulator
MTSRLLLVEDDARIAAFLRRGLAAEGYEVEVARNGEEALERLRAEEFAVVILDRTMPGMDGLEVCRRLREDGHRSAVLMLTAKDALQDRVDGLKGGADDYLTKPFAFEEVLARVEALLRRAAPPRSASVLRVRELRLDLHKKIVWMGERRIALTPREFALLACLMENAGTVVTREELLRRVWNLKFDPGTKVLDVYIRFLRRKIERPGTQPLIQTVRGFGYKITPPNDG